MYQMTTEANPQTPARDHTEANRREQQGQLFGDLGVVLERFWTFYEAMRYGKPVQNSDETLAQMVAALRSGARRVHRAGSLSAPAVADQRDVEVC